MRKSIKEFFVLFSILGVFCMTLFLVLSKWDRTSHLYAYDDKRAVKKTESRTKLNDTASSGKQKVKNNIVKEDNDNDDKNIEKEQPDIQPDDKEEKSKDDESEDDSDNVSPESDSTGMPETTVMPETTPEVSPDTTVPPDDESKDQQMQTDMPQSTVKLEETPKPEENSVEKTAVPQATQASDESGRDNEVKSTPKADDNKNDGENKDGQGQNNTKNDKPGDGESGGNGNGDNNQGGGHGGNGNEPGGNGEENDSENIPQITPMPTPTPTTIPTPTPIVEKAISCEWADKDNIRYGDEIDTDDIVVTLEMSDGTKRILDKDEYSITGLKSGNVGENTMKIEYKALSCELKYTVNNYIARLDYDWPTKDKCYVGEDIDSSVLKVNKVMADGSIVEAKSSEYVLSNIDNTVTDRSQRFTIECEGMKITGICRFNKYKLLYEKYIYDNDGILLDKKTKEETIGEYKKYFITSNGYGFAEGDIDYDANIFELYVNGEKKELPYQTGKRDFEVKILINAKADSEY